MTHDRSDQPSRSQDKQPREIELKLAVPDSSTEGLAEHLRTRMAKTGRTNRRHEITTYFDTPDQALLGRGMSLRIRTGEGGHVQTLKASHRETVAADRAEWEWRIKHDKPDLRPLEQILVAQDLPPKLDLQSVFSTDIDRTVSILDLDGGAATVEAAYDQGLIATADAQQPVRELELELRKGDAAPLYRLAVELHAAAPLMLESESKATRGYRLKNDTQPVARKASDVPLERHLSAVEAGRRILQAGLGHLLANQPAALAGDAEGVHQMRVAIRRVRAALVLFKPHLERHAASLFESELRRVGRIFGWARDWDVFCLQILPQTLKTPSDEAWRDLLLKPAMVARAGAHRDLCAEIRGPAFTALVLGMAAWAEGKRLLADPVRTRPIEDLCPTLLDDLARKVDRRGRRIKDRSDTELHALRKSLKKLRYGIDFVRPLFHARAINAYLRNCKKLQQTLGDINDAATAMALAERLACDVHVGLAPAVGALAEQLEFRRAEALGDLAKRWRDFAEQPKFWS
jgi:triphosphatase